MKFLLLANPVSGKGRSLKLAERAQRFLTHKGHEVAVVAIPSLELALDTAHNLLAQSSFDALIVAGGDGSIHNALPLAIKHKVPLGVISSGTGNDFARAVGMHGLAVEEVLSRIIDSPPVAYDIGVVSAAGVEKYFIQVLSTGFDSVVNARANGYVRLKGKLKYVVATLREILAFKASSFTFSVDGVRYERDAMLLAVANGANYGGGMMIAPHASGTDGKFEVLLLNKVSKFEFLRVFPKVFRGKHINHPSVELFSGMELIIDADVIAYADGESVGALPISITILPHSISTWIAK